jgi:hypothetical protein
MAWFSKKKSDGAVVEQDAAPQKKVATGPRLAVLIPDAGGVSSFRYSPQDDAGDAETMISGLRADVRRGTHAFWAMHDRPQVDEDQMHVEALVLIRAKSDSDLVYVVSFLDLESALSFTRFELRRGLYIGNVMIYWAAFTQIREELEGVTILPSAAPPSAKEWPLTKDERLAPPLPQAKATPQPVAEPPAESIAEAEARQAVERYLEQNPEKAAEPVAEQPATVEDTTLRLDPPVIAEPPASIEPEPIFEPEPVSEEAAVADALVLQHPPVAEPEPEVIIEPEATVETPPSVEHPNAALRRPTPWSPKRRWAPREGRRQEREPEETQLEPAAEEPALIEDTIAAVEVAPVVEDTTVTFEQTVAIEEPAVEQAAVKETPIAELRPAQSVLDAEESEALQAIAERVSSFAGDEEAEREDEPFIEASTIVAEPVADPIIEPEELPMEEKKPVVDPTANFPKPEKYEEFDIALEVERLLKNRKWESREGPFRGFKSPPGRF